MGKRKKSVKRPRIHWNEVRVEIGDPDQFLDFIRLKKKHPNMSSDRISYNVLKRYYSTTALERYRWLGVPLV